MYVSEIELSAPRGRFYLAQIPDMHADLKAFNEKQFKAWRDELLALPGEELLVIGQGDYVHGRLPGDKFFSASILQPDVLENLDNYANYMARYVGNLLAPLVDHGAKVLLLKGNHDAYLKDVDIVDLICDASGATYAHEEMLVRVLGRDEYGKAAQTTVYAAHGEGGSGLAGGKLNKALRSVNTADADAYLFGHIHDAINHHPAVPGLRRTGKPELILKEKLFAYTGSFVNGRTQNVYDYPSAKSLPAVNDGKYLFVVDQQAHKFYERRLMI